MKTDREVIVRHFPDPPETIDIYAVADVHLGAAEHCTNEWLAFLEAVKANPRAYLILCGDLINNATRSSVSNVFEETMRPAEQKRRMAEMLEPLADRIIAALQGNHEWRSGKDADDDPLYDIMAKLDLEDRYRQNFAVVKIQCGDLYGSSDNNPTYTIAATHGAGGGIYTGAAVNRSERFGNVIEGADVLVTGHSHKAFITKPSKLQINKQHNVVVQRPYYVIGLSSWMDYGGYALRKMLLPSSNMAQVIHLGGRKFSVSVEVG